MALLLFLLYPLLRHLPLPTATTTPNFPSPDQARNLSVDHLPPHPHQHPLPPLHGAQPAAPQTPSNPNRIFEKTFLQLLEMGSGIPLLLSLRPSEGLEPVWMFILL